MSWKLVAHVLVVVLSLAACGRSPRSAAPTPEPTASDHSDEDEVAGGRFGSPANQADAARTISVDALDTMRFGPAEIPVKEGETVLFSITNPGRVPHDFTLGDPDFQAEHEREMASTGYKPHDEPYAVVLQAGETKKLAWRFTAKGEVLYGCHQPGHYQAGMVGKVVVS